MKKILLVEDDISLSRGISFKLKKEGYEVFVAATVADALTLFKENQIDLVISDVGLEEGDGFTLCHEIRKLSNVYLIFLTALDQEVDIVTGYDLGADDYMTKPFSLMVLVSKVHALMRRLEKETVSTSYITCEHIKFYKDEMKVYNQDQEVTLSKNEYKLLKILIHNPKRTVTKEQLLTALWDQDDVYVDENTVAVNIRRLREKIECNPSKPELIKNIRGIGYRWDKECIGS